MTGKKGEKKSIFKIKDLMKAIEIVPYRNSWSVCFEFCIPPTSFICTVFLNHSYSGSSSPTHSFLTPCFESPAQFPWVNIGIPVICWCSLVTPEAKKFDLVWLSRILLFLLNIKGIASASYFSVLFALLVLSLAFSFLRCQI